MEGLGQDLVAMCVNDLACTGARPLVFLDYLAVGRLDPGEAEVLVRSIAEACAAVGCALAGGRDGRDAGALRARPLRPGRLRLRGRRAVRRCSAPTACARATRSSGCRPRGSTRTATRWCGRWSTPARSRPTPICCWRRPGSTSTRSRRSGGRWTCARRPTSRAAGCPRTCRGRCRGASAPSSTAGSWEPGPAIAAVVGDRAGGQEEAWSTFNMGLGMCVVVAERRGAALAVLPEARVVGRVAGPAGVRNG